MLSPLPAPSRASPHVLFGRLARKPRAWRTPLPLSRCNHCEHQLPVEQERPIQGVRVAATLGTQTIDQTFDLEPTQSYRGPRLPDLSLVRVFDLGGFYYPRYDFSHFNQPSPRICQGPSPTYSKNYDSSESEKICDRYSS